MAILDWQGIHFVHRSAFYRDLWYWTFAEHKLAHLRARGPGLFFKQLILGCIEHQSLGK